MRWGPVGLQRIFAGCRRELLHLPAGVAPQVGVELGLAGPEKVIPEQPFAHEVRTVLSLSGQYLRHSRKISSRSVSGSDGPPHASAPAFWLFEIKNS